MRLTESLGSFLCCFDITKRSLKIKNVIYSITEFGFSVKSQKLMRIDWL